MTFYAVVVLLQLSNGAAHIQSNKNFEDYDTCDSVKESYIGQAIALARSQGFSVEKVVNVSCEKVIIYKDA